MKIISTPRSFGSKSKKPLELLKEKGYQISLNDTGKPYSKEEMKKLVQDVDGIILGVDCLDAEVLENAKNLKVISKYGVGMDNIDLDYAEKKGIRVTNTQGALADAVADLTFGLMLAIARGIPYGDKVTKNGDWEKIVGQGVQGKTLGVIGMGNIGKELVKRSTGFAMKVLAFDLVVDKEFAKEYNVEYVNLDTLLKSSDFISIHTILNDETRGMIAGEELKLMKKSAYIINTARGGIVDEEALYWALKNKEIAGVALDTYVEEPPTESPLRELDNIIMTPHMGSATLETVDRMSMKAAQNLIEAMENSN